MSPETWASIGVSAVTGVCGVWAARAARRTPRQEKRDDFTVIRDSLQHQIDGLKADAASQQDQISGQGAAISWLVTDRHSLVGYIRQAGMEPPAPRPIPVRARPFLDHIDV
ncbi:hypothetical protein ABZ957_03520 [Streptomyces sp. NPDC046316]|uniref:hypothetical protein n=1 Tax=Streptomyces sp. NPDC046316 TaxID=3154494 RepID=UPI0033FA5D6C